ncbi:MAG: AEC family transporter [Cyclobacteriaceae bacterium]
MLSFLQALLPIFAVVVIGQVFYRYDFPGRSFWPLADRLTYYVLLPALLTSKVAEADFSGSAVLPMAGLLVVATLGIAGLLVLLQFILKMGPPQFTSVFQGSIRPNTYVGLAAAGALYQEQGQALVAIAVAGVVPLVNVLSVWAFTHYIPQADRSVRSLAATFFTNPLIIACLLGILLNQTGMPAALDEAMGIFSRGALPLGLLSVGAGLNFKALKGSVMKIGLTSGLKLLGLPAMVVLLFAWFDVGGEVYTMGILYGAVPCAVSSYILARQLGGDSELMAGIITFETFAAMFSMPLILWLFS